MTLKTPKQENSFMGKTNSKKPFENAKQMLMAGGNKLSKETKELLLFEAKVLCLRNHLGRQVTERILRVELK
jgi:hypothetical protein